MTDHPLLFIEEVAALCRTSVGTVRHWMRTGRLPSLRPGRRRMVRRVDLEKFLDDAARSPKQFDLDTDARPARSNSQH